MTASLTGQEGRGPDDLWATYPPAPPDIMKWKLQGDCKVQGKAGRPHLPAGASSQVSHHAPPLSSKAAAHGHGRCGRKRNRCKLAHGAKCGAKAPGWVWAHGPLGVLGSPPLAVSGRVGGKQPATRPCHKGGRQRGPGAPDPGCLAQCAHKPALLDDIRAGRPDRSTPQVRQMARARTGLQKGTRNPMPARTGTDEAGRGWRTKPVFTAGTECSRTGKELTRGSSPANEGAYTRLQQRTRQRKNTDPGQRGWPQVARPRMTPARKVSATNGQPSPRRPRQHTIGRQHRGVGGTPSAPQAACRGKGSGGRGRRTGRAGAGSSHKSPLQTGLQLLVGSRRTHASHGMDVREWC